MTRTMRTLAMAAVASLVASGAFAAERVMLNVEVPFDFVVADQQLPSGVYSIESGANPYVVRIYTKSRDRVVTAFWVPARESDTESGELVFQKVGGQRILRQIHTADGVGLHLPATSKQRKAQDAAVAAAQARKAPAKSVGMP